MNKCVKTAELFSCEVPYLCDFFSAHEYPWQMLPEIKEFAKKLVSEGIEGFTEIKPGVLVGKGVKIHESAVIEPPAVIGHGCEVRVGAYIRGNVITGENCVIGNSSELKNCILLSHVQVPHYNYVGDSVLGNRAHMGAGSICSNLKSDKGNVAVKGDEIYETGLRKFGAILGDGADIGCGSVLNPGTVIGRESSVYPLTSVRGIIPCRCIVKSSSEIVVRRNSDKEENRQCAE